MIDLKTSQLENQFRQEVDKKIDMYMFFIRSFNDIDHITPIVWKMNLKNHPVAVYCLNPQYDIHNDYRLQFMKMSDIKVDYIYNNSAQNLGILHRIIRVLFLSSFSIVSKLDIDTKSRKNLLFETLQRLVNKIGYYLYSMAKRKYYDMTWAQSILEQTGTRVLCFDWIRPEEYVVDVLLKAAREMAIPALALPHGVFVYTNDCITIGAKKQGTVPDGSGKYGRYDYIIVQNKLFKDYISRSGIEREKIVVLGSSRYCNEWMRQNRKILPRTMTMKSKDIEKLKVVFMTTRISYRIDVDRMFRTFDLLSKVQGVETVIKPHTRTAKEAHLYENLPLPNVSHVSSVELCEWADVVMIIGSSIIVEALMQGKPALYLKYLHDNTTIYESFEACWTISDEKELQSALNDLTEERHRVPYSDENVNKFLEQVIYGDRSELDILKNYEEFISHCSI
jgi:hypothetical protein